MLRETLQMLHQRCREAYDAQDHRRVGYFQALATVASRLVVPDRWIVLLSALDEFPTIERSSPLASLHDMLVVSAIPIPMFDGLLRGFEALLQIGVPTSVVMRAVDVAALTWVSIEYDRVPWQPAFRAHLTRRGYSASMIAALADEQAARIRAIEDAKAARPT